MEGRVAHPDSSVDNAETTATRAALAQREAAAAEEEVKGAPAPTSTLVDSFCSNFAVRLACLAPTYRVSLM